VLVKCVIFSDSRVVCVIVYFTLFNERALWLLHVNLPLELKIILVRLWDYSLIRSWNKTGLSNVDKVSSSRKQRVFFFFKSVYGILSLIAISAPITSNSYINFSYCEMEKTFRIYMHTEQSRQYDLFELKLCTTLKQ